MGNAASWAPRSGVFTGVAFVATVGALLLLTTCEHSQNVTGPSFAISDGAHSGNRNFFFLPPLVPDPSHDPDFDPGAFDPALQPSVEICLLDGSACAASQPAGFPIVFTTTAGPGSETVRLVPTDQLYLVNWNAGDFSLDPASFYRIQVLVGGAELGYADVDVVDNGRELRNVNTNEYIGLIDGRTLPIKFRIERGAITLINVAEAIAVRDQTDVNPPRDIAIRETVHVSDAVGVLPPVAVILAERVHVADDPRVLPPLSVLVNESVLVTDRDAVLPPIAVNVAELVAVADRVNVLPPVQINVAEPVAAADRVGVLPPISIAVRESIAVTDAVTVTPP